MRVNVYAEELTDRVELISKEIDGQVYTAVRFYMELPCTTTDGANVRGPFMHRPGDDDSAAVTFWGKRELRGILAKALDLLDKHYAAETPAPETVKVNIDALHPDVNKGIAAILNVVQNRRPLNLIEKDLFATIEDICLQEVRRHGDSPST